MTVATETRRGADPAVPAKPRLRAVAIAGALVLALAGLLLPPSATAALLVGSSSPIFATVVSGAWIFKLVLLAHAAILLGAASVRLRAGGEPLKAIATAENGLVEPRTLWLLAALLIAATVLRFIGMNDGLWFDEIRTLVGYARLPVREIIATYDSQNQHVLYSLLARGSFNIFGESAWALRLPAILLGIAGLGTVYWFGTVVADRRQALLATALLTFSYHHVWFSQNARGYTALLLWTLIASGVFLRMLATRGAPSLKLPALYALVMALAVYTHVTAVLIVFAHALIWMVLAWQSRNRDGVGARRWLPLSAFVLAGTLSLQLYALVLPQFMGTLEKSGMPGVTTDWKNPLWFAAEMVRGLSEGLPGGLMGLIAGATVATAGLVSYFRQDRTIAITMVLPGAVTAAAVFAMGHNLWPRFFFFCAGFAALIAVRGTFVLAGVLGRRAGTVATALLVLLAAASALTVPRAWQPKQDYAGALSYIERERAAGDAVVTLDLATYPYEQYYRSGWTAVTSHAELERLERTHGKTWVLYTFPARLSAVQPEIWDRLQRQYRTAAEFPGTVGGGDIIVKVLP